MPVRHDFTSSDHSLPVFLSKRTEEYEEPERPSWLRRLSLFVMAVGVIGAAMTLSLGNPLVILGLADNSPAPPAADQSASSTAAADDTHALPQAVAALPAREDTAAPAAPSAPSTPASDNSQAQAAEPPADALLKQFQSWAAAQDAQPQADAPQDTPRQAEPIRPIVQDAQPQAAPAQAVPDAPTTQVMRDDPPAPVRAAPKHRKPRPVQNARAEIRTPRPARAAVPPDRAARADARPPQPEQLQPQPQSPSFLQSIGVRPQQ